MLVLVDFSKLNIVVIFNRVMQIDKIMKTLVEHLIIVRELL